MVVRVLLCMLAFVFSFSAAGLAETRPAGQVLTAQASDQGRPARGLSMARVEAKYGQPSKKYAAVGDPPITRWEYPGFIVYFEYQTVIHSVTKRTAQR